MKLRPPWTDKPRKLILLLFETTGLAAEPFLNQGYDVISIDTLNTDELTTRQTGNQHLKLNLDILEQEEEIIEMITDPMYDLRLIVGFPPCTDLAVSGAAHFARKRAADPLFQEKALNLFLSVARISEAASQKLNRLIPYAAENPISVVSSMYRKPNFRFDPYEYGGYLPGPNSEGVPTDSHPLYPNHYPPQDAYTKRTCFWSGNGFKMPQPKPVTPVTGGDAHNNKRGGKGAETKRIRSCSPRGIFVALADMGY